MDAFANDIDALRLQFLFEEVGDLRGHPLLNLHTLREAVKQTRQLRHADHLAVRQIAD